jgi:RNA polymerase sigma-70 factor, ECF subfamily
MISPEEWQGVKDESVLKAAIDDPRLFRVLLDRYQEAFLRKAQTVVHDWEMSADVVQETFIRIYKYSHTFAKREGIEFKSWAYKILMNTAFTHYAKKEKERGRVEYSDAIQLPEMQSEDKSFERLELTDAVGLVLNRMPLKLATVLKAHYFEGKSYKDISSEQDISVAALKMKMYRARQEFKTHSKDIFEMGSEKHFKTPASLD